MNAKPKGKWYHLLIILLNVFSFIILEVNVVHIYEDDEGVSHFRDFTLQLEDQRGSGETRILPEGQIVFVEDTHTR
jgi:hypothetical protein